MSSAIVTLAEYVLELQAQHMKCLLIIEKLFELLEQAGVWEANS